MKARIKEDGRFPRLTFFSGREFTKGEWRPVPAGFEDAALADDRLETQDDPQPDTIAPEDTETGELTVLMDGKEVPALIATDFETAKAPQKLAAVGKTSKTEKAGKTGKTSPASRKAGK